VIVSGGLASKPVAMVSSGLASNPATVVFSNQETSGDGFL
jgi:hypothetical protein